ncbi:hypothetical protein Sjap_014128 [Stephania japonica]|uniref:V-SNARE coiled-coil homology domain-containing protein n=1 Tax=Stephania japonica TaxID=461633 RepID=A0AAP0P1Y7_9MAGN
MYHGKSIFPSFSLIQNNLQHGSLTAMDLDVKVALHYGIPPTASILAFDPIQRLLAIGTLDGRIKVIGGDNIEGLLTSPKQLPYKNLEFLHNQGFLVSVSNENDIQVWDLENRCLTYSLQWESNVTAFSVLQGTYFMYGGDENGLTSVLKYDAEEKQLLHLPYNISADYVAEAAGIAPFIHASVVGVLPQPGSSGNRLLIAYDNGLIVLWDISSSKVVTARGYKDLLLKDEEFVRAVNDDLQDTRSEQEQLEKEISSLCWASSTGSIVAVGYVDGDIMFWNLSNASSPDGQEGRISSNDVIKLQLSSSEKRIPVIVLHWSARSASHNDRLCQLYIYGGDEIGSEEVLTALSLEWSSGMETVKCVGRVDLALSGSFADMILTPKAGATNNDPAAALFLLTNPGQLHVYADVSLTAAPPKLEKGLPIPSMEFPVTVPIADPCMTAAKLSLVPPSENSSKDLVKLKSSLTGGAPSLSVDSKWPVTGGVPSQLSFSEDKKIERVYIGGYQDGSVRMWDATNSVLSLIFVMEGEVEGVEVTGASTSVTTLAFCSLTSSLAVGNEHGLVRICRFNGSSEETNFHFVTQTKHEDCLPDKSSPIVSIFVKTFPDISSLLNSPKNSGPQKLNDHGDEHSEVFSEDGVSHEGPTQSCTSGVINEEEAELQTSSENAHCGDRDLFVLLCTETALRLYSFKSMIKGDKKLIHKVKLMKPSCWTAIFKKKDGRSCGLVLLYQTGEIEFRSLPDLGAVGESSLMSTLRWSYRLNMNKTMSSSEDGVISLANGSEMAFISCLACKNNFGTPESLPSLHDKILAAAADAAISFSSHQKTKQTNAPGILTGIMKGFKGKKVGNTEDVNKSLTRSNFASHLESIFQRAMFSEKPATLADAGLVELSIGLCFVNDILQYYSLVCFSMTSTSFFVDDIEIDEPLPVASSSSHEGKKQIEGRLSEKEREKLFEGANEDIKPRLRTPEEIIAKYRKAGDASAVAAHARDKLVQRQEKLERLGQRTAELQSGAESFASMADELVKVMENRKWWQI